MRRRRGVRDLSRFKRACRQAIHKIAQRFRDHEVHNFYKRQFYEYRAYAGEAAAKATVRDYRRAYKHTRCSGREYILFRFSKRAARSAIPT